MKRTVLLNILFVFLVISHNLVLAQNLLAQEMTETTESEAVKAEKVNPKVKVDLIPKEVQNGPDVAPKPDYTHAVDSKTAVPKTAGAQTMNPSSDLPKPNAGEPVEKLDLDSKANPKALTMYVPHLALNPTNPQEPEVILSGLASPKQIIKKGTKSLSHILSSKEIKRISWEEALVTTMPIEVGADGYFEIRLRLPTGQVQLGLEYLGKKIIVVLDISESEVVAHNQSNLAKNPNLDGKYTVWAGVGMNYVSFEQNGVFSFNASNEIYALDFNFISGPSFFAKGEGKITKHWNGIVSLKSSPGTLVSQDLPLDGSRYIWWILNLESVHLPPSLKFKKSSRTYQLGYSLGIQYHLVPFLDRISSSQLSLRENELAMASGGLHLVINPQSRIYYEIFLRGLVPFYSGDLFSVSTSPAMDGSLGAIYKYTDRYRLGFFWYGAWQKYDFDTSNKDVHGVQKLFYSNLEIRLGLTF